MLKLTNIRKSYRTGSFTQTALDGVSITFRSNEFTAVLGPSGSGKTTMLNIIGGLDHYESGDLEIDGISTKEYSSRDWDTYRNNRIGFVFQSYNLIPHQTVLANVELALTLSGVSVDERRKRAIKALEEVGLKEHTHKKPNQLSGGQMQRVAIARALINNPEILLADEPTGALDSKTSTQVLELLTNIAKKRLVIMVTHNSDLAEKYANRIIQLTDGQIVSDSRHFKPTKEQQYVERKVRKASMSFLTAISLSFSNLMTKKGRTFVTALAGSIGIIGIAAILSLANGINLYIEDVERETLSLYPLSIQQSGFDFSSMLVEPHASRQANANNDVSEQPLEDVTSEGVSERGMINNLFSYQNKNDLTSLKYHLEENKELVGPYVNSIQYVYNVTPQIYLADTSNSIEQVNPDAVLSEFGMSSSINSMMGMNFGTMQAFHELPGEVTMFEHQYYVVAGRWPKNYNEAILVLSHGGKVSDFHLYSMGLRDRNTLRYFLEAATNNTDYELDENTNITYSYESLMTPQFKIINPADYYTYDEEYQIWVDNSNDESYTKSLIENGIELNIVGVVRPDPNATTTSLSSGINYTPQLSKHLMDEAASSIIVQEQLANPSINVFTGRSFVKENEDNYDTKFNVSDFISIDESKITDAFNIDTSKINIEYNVGNFSLDMTRVPMPQLEFDIAELTKSIAEQVDIPEEQLVRIMISTFMNFINEEVSNGVTNPQQIAANLDSYLARPDVQQEIYSQVEQIMDPVLMETLVNEAIQNYMETAMQAYAIQIGEVLKNQIEHQSQLVMEQILLQLPQQLRNSMTIDTDTFQQAFQFNLEEEEMLKLMNSLMNPTESTFERNLTTLNYADEKSPSQINIYPLNFQSKQSILNFLDNYNDEMKAQGHSDKVVIYSDIVGTMMSSVTDIVNTISYALVAFVAISLIVSSIMIGVITFISVLERKKEIGILRALGASKQNIRRVFNAETLIIGFVAGVLGITVTILLCIPVNVIVAKQFGIKGIAQLPTGGAIVLIIVSMCLTFLAGLFPSSTAARKDPVEALRSE
jgi:ABC-type lipoprotein export system ATPase subunit